jgi:hypothetical protein
MVTVPVLAIVKWFPVAVFGDTRKVELLTSVPVGAGVGTDGDVGDVLLLPHDTSSSTPTAYTALFTTTRR